MKETLQTFRAALARAKRLYRETGARIRGNDMVGYTVVPLTPEERQKLPAKASEAPE